MDKKIFLVSLVITVIILASFLIYWGFGGSINKCKQYERQMAFSCEQYESFGRWYDQADCSKTKRAVDNCGLKFNGEGMALMFFLSLPFLIPFHILSFITLYKLLSLLFKKDKSSVKNYLTLIVLIAVIVIIFLIKKSLYLSFTAF